MKLKLYSARNAFSLLVHYGAIGAIGAGAMLFGQPLAVAAGIGLTLAVIPSAVKRSRKFLENELTEHPNAHEHSPNLGRIVDELNNEANLSPDQQKVYSFKLNKCGKEELETLKEEFKQLVNDAKNSDTPNKSKIWAKGKEVFAKLKEVATQDMMRKANETPNAAASNFGKPVIIISDKLLELLDDDEEKAVLAHEFAHAAAEHQRMSMPQRLIGSAAKITNTLTLITTWVGSGLTAIASSIGAATVTYLAYRKYNPDTKLVNKKIHDLTASEIESARKAKTLGNAFSSAAAVGTLTYFNPVYLPVYAATKTMNTACNLTLQSMSRSNEYQADRGAVLLGASPLALITSLRKMNVLMERSQLNALKLNRLPEKGKLSKLWGELTATHPTVEKRIGRLTKIARKNGYGEDEINRAVHAPVDVDHVGDVSEEVFAALKL